MKHEKQRKLLQNSVAANKLPHAMLFCGRDKIGKYDFALELSKYIYCESENKPCQKCRNCIDVDKNCHPDLLVIGNDNSEITVAQIRDAIWKLSLSPYSSSSKIAIINNGHKMNKEAQNCFLKTLEEPRGNTHIIVVTPHPDSLLATINSRAQKIKFNLPFSGELNEGEQKLISQFVELKNADMAVRVNFIKTLCDEEDKNINDKICGLLSLWTLYLRNVLFDKIKQEGKIREFDDYSVGRIKKIINLITNTKYLIESTNVNLKLALEIVMLEL